MKVLVAEDDRLTRTLLKRLLAKWSYEIEAVDDGQTAFERLRDPDGPRIAVLDWMMPGKSGVDVCRELRASAREAYVYVILLTSKSETSDVVDGLDAGADDYVTKPFDEAELLSRVRAGERIARLEEALSLKVTELRSALDHVQRLQGLLPICMHCRKVRDDSNSWHRLEEYIEEHSDAMFSHGLCEDCLDKYYPDDDDDEDAPTV